MSKLTKEAVNSANVTATSVSGRFELASVLIGEISGDSTPGVPRIICSKIQNSFTTRPAVGDEDIVVSEANIQRNFQPNSRAIDRVTHTLI
jgi:hypothetical protein